MEDGQNNWPFGHQQASPWSIPAQTNPPSSPTHSAAPSHIEKGARPEDYQLNGVARKPNQHLPFGRWSLASLVSTSIPDPDHPVPLSHPLYSQVTRHDNDDDDDSSSSSSASGDHVPNPRGQQWWVDRLVAVCPVEDHRLLQKSRRLRRKRLMAEQRHLTDAQRRVREGRFVEVERLVQTQRRRRQGDGCEHAWLEEEEGDDDEDFLHADYCQQEEEDIGEEEQGEGEVEGEGKGEGVEGSWTPEEQEMTQERLTLMEQMQQQICRPWTHRCACLDENGKEREGEGDGEWICVPLPHEEGEEREEGGEEEEDGVSRCGGGGRRGKGKECARQKSVMQTQQQQHSEEGGARGRVECPLFQLPARINHAVPIVDPTTLIRLNIATVAFAPGDITLGGIFRFHP